MTERTALVLGATGLIGSALLRLLLEDDHWGRVVVIARRAAPCVHPKLEWHALDYAALEAHAPLFGVHDVFCCLGTTLRQAGSREAFRRVDHDYVVTAARLARQQAAEQFLLVSAVNATADSRFFYSRVKADAESAVRALQWPALVIAQPSILLGERAEARLGEMAASWLMKGLRPLLHSSGARWLGITGEEVAQALRLAARTPAAGVRCLRYADMMALVAQAHSSLSHESER